MAEAGSTSFGMVNPAIFEHLQAKIDEDARVREELRNFLQDLEKQGKLNKTVYTIASKLNPVLGRATQSILSRAHSIPAAQRTFALVALDFVS